MNESGAADKRPWYFQPVFLVFLAGFAIRLFACFNTWMRNMHLQRCVKQVFKGYTMVFKVIK